MSALFIEGVWQQAVGGAVREIHCPADGSPVATVPEAGPEDSELAVDAARRAFDTGPWPHTDPADDTRSSGVDHAAGLGAGEAGEVAEDTDDVVDVVARLDDAFAGVERLQPRDFFLVALEDVGESVQEGAALQRGRGRPWTGVERPAGRVDGEL